MKTDPVGTLPDYLIVVRPNIMFSPTPWVAWILPRLDRRSRIIANAIAWRGRT